MMDDAAAATRHIELAWIGDFNPVMNRMIESLCLRHAP